MLAFDHAGEKIDAPLSVQGATRRTDTLPTAAHGELRLRCIPQPNAAQAALLDRLGIILPKRMRLNELDRLALSA
jgi:hypothetical protein